MWYISSSNFIWINISFNLSGFKILASWNDLYYNILCQYYFYPTVSMLFSPWNMLCESMLSPWFQIMYLHVTCFHVMLSSWFQIVFFRTLVGRGGCLGKYLYLIQNRYQFDHRLYNAIVLTSLHLYISTCWLFFSFCILGDFSIPVVTVTDIGRYLS